MYRLLILYIFFSLSSLCFSQTKTYQFTHLSSADGLSQSSAIAIEQDDLGQMWIGTRDGLNKYDGTKFTVFRNEIDNPNSISNNDILSVKQDRDGFIWVGTYNGLNKYNPRTQQFKRYFHNKTQSSLVNNSVWTIEELSNGDIWIGTAGGLSVYNKSEDSFKTFLKSSDKNSSVGNHVLSIFESQRGLIYIGTTTGLSVVENIEDSELKFKTILGSKNLYIQDIEESADGKLLLATRDESVVEYDFKTKKISPYFSETELKDKNKNARQLLFDDKQQLWVGTYNGLQISSKNRRIKLLNSKVNDSKSLSKNSIKSLFKDKKGSIWIGIGTFNSGIEIYNVITQKFDNTQLSEAIKDYIKDVGVYGIQQDEKGNIWLGTFGKGLIKYNLKTKQFTVFKFEEGNQKSLSSNLVRTVVVDSEENIWVGTERGLNMVNPKGEITNYFYNAEVQSGDDILSVFEDANNTIWAGTKAKGLFKLEANEFKYVDLETNNIKVSSIHSILQDANKNLWIATNQGLIKFNVKLNEAIVYNQKEGVISNEFNDNASLKMNNSKFYFGSPAGVTSFNSNQLTTNTYSPQVILTDFKTKNKAIDLTTNNSILKEAIPFTKSLELAYDQGNFSIDFAIPNFINSKNNKYQYRLKGLENDWVESTENTASYTIQNAGHYVFEVQGANSDGVWNTDSTQLKINVLPAPWKSWWAFLIYGLLILSTLYFLMSILKSRTKLQTELALEHLEVERTKETNRAKLEFFTNISHEFRTPLTLILGPLNQILKDYKGSNKMYKKLMVIESSSNHLLRLINRLMDFRKLENNLFKLESAEGNIVKFLKEIYLSFAEYAKDGDYEYSFHTTDDEILVYYDRYKLERVFYNLISNAFRYTPKYGKIVVRVKQHNGEIIIQVEDSGVGIAKQNQDKIFERFFEVAVNNKPDNEYNKGTGIGLSIAKNIVNLHKGEISVRSNENDKGSIFIVKLPLGRVHLKEDEIITDFKFSDDVSQYVKQLEVKNIITEDDITEQVISSEKQTILLVEDNKPLRKFMKSILKDNYNIIEAENGKKALKIAQKESPNLIVSDVVMPVMVGTELCSKIKEDIRTSHIPIILLTSRTSLIYKLEGLESGADDYISKPFDVNEFLIRIKNLLESTSRLKEKYTSEDPLQPNEIIVSSLDEKLYKKAFQIVEDNIDNENFDVQFFCSELGVSRTMLFTKVKAWTNFTPNEFIMHFRMKRAAQILEQGKINISEVSYKVGFRNPKYFSKCFQKKYGETPTQYMNRFSTDY